MKLHDPSSSPDTGLGKQADEIINEETEWTDLVENLDISRFKRRDGYPDWHTSTPFPRMFLVFGRKQKRFP